MNECLLKKIKQCDMSELGVEQLLKLINNDLYQLVQPQGRKEIWEKCAKLLINIGYPRNKLIVADLFKWLQDMNWPGSLSIRNFLITLPNDDFNFFYNHALLSAQEDSDEEWICNLMILHNQKFTGNK